MTPTAERALKRALNILAYAPNTKAQLRRKLREKGCSSSDVATVMEYLEEKGFKIEDFGEGAVIVRTVPSTLGNLKGLNNILEDFAKTLSDGNGLSFAERCDRALYTVACKAALKARVKNRPEDDENVVRMLSENTQRRYCPHGRPFIKKLPKREIEKYFDR